MSIRQGNNIIAGNPNLTNSNGEIGDIGFAPFGIDESLNLRRYLNGQVISQTQFASFTTKLKASIALYPSLATTEANWQAEVTNSVLGQCGKFVIDDENGTIRLPKVINAQGLMDLQYLGTIKNQSLPNISGEFRVYSNNADPNVENASGAFYFDTKTSGSNNYFNAAPATATFQPSYIGINASLSSSAYQNNAPVQQEAIQYPYYIQVALGVKETLPAIREYKVNNSDFFGKSMYSDVSPDNASWLVSNGSYNAKTVYPNYYDWLVSHIGETITANGGKIVLSTGTITDYDWVVNQSDETFRLPLLDGSEDLQGAASETISIGDYTLPKNGFVKIRGASSTNSRAFVWVQSNAEINADHAYSAGTLVQASAEAKKGTIVNTTYDNCTNVVATFTPAVGNGSLYYYVGDTVQDASLINAGAILEQLANKANIDFSNATRPYIVLSYHSGENGFIKLSNGFILQWGNFTSPSSGSHKVNFLTSFSGTPAVTFSRGSAYASTGIATYWGNLIQNVSTTGFYFYHDTNNETGIWWIACGF